VKIYFGYRTVERQCFAGWRVGEKWGHLDARLDLWNHSPTGYEWGYCGSGPAQLAMAILSDAIGDDEVVVLLYQQFKREVIAKFPRSNWAITQESVLRWAMSNMLDALREAQLIDLMSGAEDEQ